MPGLSLPGWRASSVYTNAPNIAPNTASPCLRQKGVPNSTSRIHGTQADRVPATG